MGAVPRIVGPWWSLYSLNLACEIEHMECWKGGRTWLEFFTDGGNPQVFGSLTSVDLCCDCDCGSEVYLGLG